MEEYNFNKLLISKISIMFTWDDNFICHYNLIAPLFQKYNLLCTFYINPGANDFYLYSEGYANVSNIGFEIGSHGYTHHHFSRLNNMEYLNQLYNSQIKIKNLCNKQPITFAFPHHDFTEDMLNQAKKVYFETRNTLKDTKRYSLKTNSSMVSIRESLDDAILKKYNIVFSGHGIIDENDRFSCGYEPIHLDFLEEILQTIKAYKEFSVETFLQGSIKSYIKNNCICNNNNFLLDCKQRNYLDRYGITKERLEDII